MKSASASRGEGALSFLQVEPGVSWNRPPKVMGRASIAPSGGAYNPEQHGSLNAQTRMDVGHFDGQFVGAWG